MTRQNREAELSLVTMEYPELTIRYVPWTLSNDISPPLSSTMLNTSSPCGLATHAAEPDDATAMNLLCSGLYSVTVPLFPLLRSKRSHELIDEPVWAASLQPYPLAQWRYRPKSSL